MSTMVTVTYFDTAMALIEVGSVRLLTDPVLDAAGATFDHGPVHLRKTSGRSVTAAALGRIDAVLLSHDQHGDNLDNAGRHYIASVPRVLTTPEGAARLGARAEGLAPWQTATVTAPDGGCVTLTAMPAQHGPDGTQEATGSVTGFMLDWPGRATGPVYVSGDTVPFDGTREIARRYAPVGLALLNLGRVQLAPMGELTFSLSAAEAAAYAAELGARWVAPLHFEGWEHFSEAREAARATLAASPVAARVRWLAVGEPTTLDLGD